MKSYSVLFLVTFIFVLITHSSAQEDRQKFFNDLAGSPEWQPDKVIETLAIEKGWYIGDLGAGGGYYTYRFAEGTGSSGKVFAADINEEFLAGIDKTAKEKGLKNVQIILSDPDDSNFDDNSLDLIFIRNAFHHIDSKNQYVKNLAEKLKPGGKIALIDYKKEASSGPPGHNVTRDEILSSIVDTELKIEKEYEFLEEQYFFVFKRE
jgi:ubiquinone/menaquinone biosynthesis C-methylase UbiE